jgi:hypothetical protein
VASTTWRGIALAIGLAAVVGACSASGATSSPTSNVAGATATPTPSAVASTSAVPTDSPTAAVTATPAPTPTKAPPKATPLPALAIGLCTAAQLKLTIDYWVGSPNNPTYPHLMATNVSSASCNMRGTPRLQIVDGSGKVLVDAGSHGGEVTTADPVYILIPGGVVYGIGEWDNWCKSAPKQKVAVAVVMPFGLGRFVAKSNGDAPIPYCSSSGHSSTVSAQAWTS